MENQDKETLKANRECSIFLGFAVVANNEYALGIDLNSIKNETPPAPDISCAIKGGTHFFEMIEITDEDLAKNVNTSLKTGKITGGAFSQDIPLLRAFSIKAQKLYSSLDGPLELLAYYDKQYPPPSDGLQSSTINRIVDVIQNMKAEKGWKRFWLFDTWNHRIIDYFPRT